jgi:hypothetical protein
MVIGFGLIIPISPTPVTRLKLFRGILVSPSEETAYQELQGASNQHFPGQLTRCLFDPWSREERDQLEGHLRRLREQEDA